MRPLWNTCLLAIATAGVYHLLLGYRADYLGHYIAGFGGTLLLLALPLEKSQRPLGWNGVRLVLLAIVLGAVGEATIFQIAIFDPVDFANQSLGACVAGLCLMEYRGGSPRFVTGIAVVSVLSVVAGVYFAFS